MKKWLHKIILCSLVLSALMMQSCFYEYPSASKGYAPGIGEDPTTVDAFLEVAFEIDWGEMIHVVDFNQDSRAATLRRHRIVIEVLDKNDKVCHDVEYLSDEEFAHGILRHRLSVPLAARNYDIAVWYDRQDDNGIHSFSADNLSRVKLTNTSTTDADLMRCAYASHNLDLRDYNVEEETSVASHIELDHPGARFEIIATDIQQFITDQKEALLQDDSFTAHLSFRSMISSFNIYSGEVIWEDENFNISGRMRLPFAEYDELKIAEGFVFCGNQDEVSVTLSVKNSALVTVTQTDVFSFPVKRGYVTKVTGDFLTNSIDGLFSIDNVWDGIIEIEI